MIRRPATLAGPGGRLVGLQDGEAGGLADNAVGPGQAGLCVARGGEALVLQEERVEGGGDDSPPAIGRDVVLRQLGAQVD